MGQLKYMKTLANNELKGDGQDFDRNAKEDIESNAEVPQKVAKIILGDQTQR